MCYIALQTINADLQLKSVNNKSGKMSPEDFTNAGTLSTFYRKGYLLPEWPLVKYWQNFVTVGVFFTCLIDPLIFAFDASKTWLLGLAYFLDVILAVDVVLQFFTAYDDNGCWITNRKAICKRYMFSLASRFIFVIDILSVLPLEAAAPAFTNVHVAWAGLRMNRLLRFYRILSVLCKFLCSLVTLKTQSSFSHY